MRKDPWQSRIYCCRRGCLILTNTKETFIAVTSAWIVLDGPAEGSEPEEYWLKEATGIVFW